jgi:hypothetical protein
MSAVLHRHNRAHVRRREGDVHLAGKFHADGAADEFHGDLGMVADQVQRPFMGHLRHVITLRTW